MYVGYMRLRRMTMTTQVLEFVKPWERDRRRADAATKLARPELR